ncbi:hypothetical protein ABH940_005550 [Streptacidiphilus sp. BW17]|uniref:hypothetical protein n=1 Tax=Streptacidiphilus sp. BW17 TaxID=3156274 RepID=UPI003516163F
MKSALELHDQAAALERINFEVRRLAAPHAPLTPAVSALVTVMSEISSRVSTLLPFSSRAEEGIQLVQAYTDALDSLGEAVSELSRAQRHVNTFFIIAARRTSFSLDNPKIPMPPGSESDYAVAIEAAVDAIDFATAELRRNAAELASPVAGGPRAGAALARSGQPMSIEARLASTESSFTVVAEPAASTQTSRIRGVHR